MPSPLKTGGTIATYSTHSLNDSTYHPRLARGKSPKATERRGHYRTLQKGDKTEHGKCRGISLVSHAGKVLLKVVARRLSAYYETKGLLLEEQCGFRTGRSTTDMIFMMRRVKKIGRKAGVSLFMCFIDLQKAHDTVDSTLMWQVLTRIGVPPQMTAAIQQFHDGMRVRVRPGDGDCSDWFEVKKGLRQGSVTFPLLFNIFFAAVLTVVLQNFSEDTYVQLRLLIAGRPEEIVDVNGTGAGYGLRSFVVRCEVCCTRMTST